MSALTDVDAELYVYLTNATFAAVSGRGNSNVVFTYHLTDCQSVFILRQRLAATAETPEVRTSVNDG